VHEDHDCGKEDPFFIAVVFVPVQDVSDRESSFQDAAALACLDCGVQLVAVSRWLWLGCEMQS